MVAGLRGNDKADQSGLPLTHLRATLIYVKSQNVTLSLPQTVLRKAKVLAAQKQMSLSALLTEALGDLVHREDAYQLARVRALESMKTGFPMGTGGTVSWSRDELHER